MANEIEIESDKLGEKLFTTFEHAVDGMSDELAKFIVTGRANFLQFFQGIAEQLLKAPNSIQLWKNS